MNMGPGVGYDPIWAGANGAADNARLIAELRKELKRTKYALADLLLLLEKRMPRDPALGRIYGALWEEK
jgi:hypothetical protein